MGPPSGIRCSAAIYDMGPKTNFAFCSFIESETNSSPLPMPMDPPCQCPPPLERKIWRPLLMDPESRKKKNAPPPPYKFFPYAHTNWTILPRLRSASMRVSCLILNLALLSQNSTIAAL